MGERVRVRVRVRVGDMGAHDVARAGRLEHAEEGPVSPVLRVQLDDLLVVIRPLQELDARIEGPAVRVEQHLHAVDGRVERVGADGATLNVHGRGKARFRWAVAGLGLG